MIFKERVRYLLDSAKMTNKELAKATGIAPSTITYWFSKTSNPNKNYVKAVADYFNIEFEWLYNGIGNTPENLKVPENGTKKSIKGKEYDIKSETIIIENSGKCESCKKLNNRIEFLEDLLRERDTEIARLNQEIGRLKPNQEEPKKGKAHYG